MRSRLYFQTAKANDGSQPNKNLRTLESKKSNYGPADGQITLEWKNGLFVPVYGPSGLDKMAAEEKVDDMFLTLLKRFNAQGRNAADRKGASYAPALFTDEPDNQGFGKKQFEDAMRRLFKDNKIHIVDIGRKSKPSRTLMPVEK